MDQTFFGYKPEDRLKLYDSLFELIWWGEGRWSFDDIYQMPLPIRKFWISKVNEKLEMRYSKGNNTGSTPKKPKTKTIAKSPL